MNLKRKDLKIIMLIIGIFIIYLLAVTFVFKRNPLDVISPSYIVNSDGLFGIIVMEKYQIWGHLLIK